VLQIDSSSSLEAMKTSVKNAMRKIGFKNILFNIQTIGSELKNVCRGSA
jgi:hypothetical protein